MVEEFKGLYRKFFPTYLNLQLPKHFFCATKVRWRVAPYCNIRQGVISYGVFGTKYRYGLDPFVNTVNDMLNGIAEPIRLREHFELTKNLSIAEFFNGSIRSEIGECPANLIQYLLPWSPLFESDSSLGDLIDGLYARNPARRKCAEHGIEISQEFSRQTQSFGPACPELIQCESLRYQRTLESILKHGYLVNHGGSGAVQATLLRQGTRRVWHVCDGLHRTACLLALGMENIGLRSSGIFVDRSDLSFLPSVRKAIYSRDEAEYIFDFYMDAT